MNAIFFRKLLVIGLCFFMVGCSIGAKSLPASYSPDSNKSGIFGVFIQRLGFSSGGTAQFIYLRETNTKKRIRFQVKPTWTSKRENFFSAEIPPGTYELFIYAFSEGYTQYTQYIIKAESQEELEKLIESYNGKMEENPFPKYQIEVKPNEVVYVGSWDFSGQIPVFKNEPEKAHKMGLEEKKFNKVESVEVRLPE